MTDNIGLGSAPFKLAVSVPNRPPLDEYEILSSLKPLKRGEIAEIARLTGNHWRKIFNVYAKIAFKLCSEGNSTWQQLRDESLLQAGSGYGLLFDTPNLNRNTVHIITGKQHAHSLGLIEEAVWVDQYFAINRNRQYIVAPYFDYRQLSNVKIDMLVELINTL